MKKNPNFPGIHFALGGVYYNKLDDVNAEKEFRLALSEDPNLPMANYYLADILMRSQKIEQAVPLLQIVVAASPQFMRGYLQLGKCYAAQGKLQDALKLLLKAVELEQSKDYAGAERVYREALLASADDPEILKRLGLACQQQGKYEESIEIFQRILRRAPVYPGVNSLLAISYYSLNKFGKTIEASRKELTGNPKDKQARYYLALALSASGQLFEAIQQLEGLQAEDPQNLAVVYQLVVDYKAAAQQTGQRLVKMAPDSEFAYVMRAEALADGEHFRS